MGYATLAGVHWLTYASWPIALLHGLGTGSDVKQRWLLALSIALPGDRARRRARARARRLARAAARVRGAALGGAGGFALFLVLWLPGGPLGSEWARRSGTPASLLVSTPAPPSTGSTR